MIEDLWKESSLGAALETLAEERGLARGMERGIAQGLERGMAQGMRHLAQVALEARFGALAPDIVEALQAADEPLLVALVTDAGIARVEDVRRRLGLASAG